MAKVVKTFRCDPDLWARVAYLAADEGTNVSAVIVGALEQYADPGDEGEESCSPQPGRTRSSGTR